MALVTVKAVKYMEEAANRNFLGLSRTMTRGVCENVKRHIHVFHSPYEK